MMSKFISVIVLATSFMVSQAFADVPCDFKGISVGDTMTSSEIMTRLGIKKYKVNPNKPDSYGNAMEALRNEYGIIGAMEIVDWNIGPHCDKNSCKIPYGVNVGSNIPASIFVDFTEDKNQITLIRVVVNSMYWDNLVPVLKQKYGSNWKLESMPMVIMNYKSHSQRTVEREILTHRTGGKNLKTGDACQLSGTNFDVIFEHGDPLGKYHAVFDIELISRNF